MKEIELPAEDLFRSLTGIELLEHCSEKDKLELVQAATVLWFQDTETIVREGDPGLAFYFVLSGAADVMKGGVTVGQIPVGGYFGGVSLLEGIPRTADVVAAGETVVLALARPDFRSLLVKEARIAMKILFEEKRRLDQSGALPQSS